MKTTTSRLFPLASLANVLTAIMVINLLVSSIACGSESFESSSSMSQNVVTVLDKEFFAKTGNISTQNSKPIAKAGEDLIGIVGNSVQLNGKDSYDPDGESLDYLWAIIEKPEGSSADLEEPTLKTPDFILDAVGDYVVVLIVSDGKLDSRSDKITISSRKPSEIAGIKPRQE